MISAAPALCPGCGSVVEPKRPSDPGPERKWCSKACSGAAPRPSRKRARNGSPSGRIVLGAKSVLVHPEERDPSQAREVRAEIATYDRPTTRGECGEQRPCPWVSCRHHLYLDVNPETGSVKLNFPDREPWELERSCSLDVAEQHGKTLDEVGETMNVTRERVRQLETVAMRKLKRIVGIEEL